MMPGIRTLVNAGQQPYQSRPSPLARVLGEEGPLVGR